MEKRKKNYKKVLIDRVHPNNWNPNEMDATFFKKLKRGLASTLEEAGEIPPIIVRPLKSRKAHYEVIDGFHRWKALTELKQERIGVFIIRVSNKTARILTNTLNYLRGEPNREKYAAGIVEMIEAGASTTELENLLPEGEDELAELLEEADVSVEAFANMLEEDKDELKEVTDDDDIWVDVKFRVSVPQAQVIEKELARIGGALKGKGKRGRSLEFMAVQSSHSELPDDLS